MRFLGFGNGSAGTVALGSYTQTWITCSGTQGQSTLSVTGTFSAGDRLFIHQSRGGANVGLGEDNFVVSYDAGTITLLYPLENTYTDSGASQAQVAVVAQASSVSGSYTVPAWDGDKGGLFVMACSGVFGGTVDASGQGFRGGASRFGGGGNIYGYCGEGTAGASAINANLNANGNGAGSTSVGSDGNYESGGSGGGNGTAGSQGEIYSSTGVGHGGAEAGTADLTTIVFGGGGGGALDGWTTDSAVTAGANGGGIIIIYAGKLSSSSIVANGATAASSSYTAGWSCGGGGAGGSILIKTRTAVLGSNALSAAAGAGGLKSVNNAWNSRNSGGNGGVGRIRVEACSLTGTTSPTASTSVGGYSYCGQGVYLF